MHLDEISRHVAVSAHAVILMDRAGWHTTGKLDVPDNITIILLPSRSPELNPVENIWQYIRQNWLSNRVFANYNLIYWNARLGARRSVILTAGIKPSVQPLALYRITHSVNESNAPQPNLPQRSRISSRSAEPLSWPTLRWAAMEKARAVVKLTRSVNTIGPSAAASLIAIS